MTLSRVNKQWSLKLRKDSLKALQQNSLYLCIFKFFPLLAVLSVCPDTSKLYLEKDWRGPIEGTGGSQASHCRPSLAKIPQGFWFPVTVPVLAARTYLLYRAQKLPALAANVPRAVLTSSLPAFLPSLHITQLSASRHLISKSFLSKYSLFHHTPKPGFFEDKLHKDGRQASSKPQTEAHTVNSPIIIPSYSGFPYLRCLSPNHIYFLRFSLAGSGGTCL